MFIQIISNPCEFISSTGTYNYLSLLYNYNYSKQDHDEQTSSEYLQDLLVTTGSAEFSMESPPGLHQDINEWQDHDE